MVLNSKGLKQVREDLKFVDRLAYEVRINTSLSADTKTLMLSEAMEKTSFIVGLLAELLTKEGE